MITCALEGPDISVNRGGNHPPAMWQFLVSENPDVLFDLSGSIFKLRVVYPEGSIDAATDDTSGALTIDLPTSIVSWNYSIEDSRLIPAGRIATYELERWIGVTQQVLAAGSVIGQGGGNPDV